MRSKYHVVKRPDGNWQGKLEKSERASVVAETKEKALKNTIEIAKGKGNSQVIIHKSNGDIQSERTYGNDPFPPTG